MKPPALHWVVIVTVLGAIVATAFVFFRNPGPTYAEVSRGGAPGTAGAFLQYDVRMPARYPNARAPADNLKGNDATFGVILPYLATPH